LLRPGKAEVLTASPNFLGDLDLMPSFVPAASSPRARAGSKAHRWRS